MILLLTLFFVVFFWGRFLVLQGPCSIKGVLINSISDTMLKKTVK